MQNISSRPKGPKPDTQPAIFLPVKSRLLLLYGSGTNPVTISCLSKLATSTVLQPRILNLESRRLSARTAVDRLTSGTAASHLMLCIHGGILHRSSAPVRKASHRVMMANGRNDSIDTMRFLEWVTTALASTGRAKSPAPAALPFVHLLSCSAAILREQIKPDSSLWRSAYFLIYSSKRSTSLSACGSSMATAVRYVDWCERQRREVDPLKLLYLAGLRRGECMTLMGGDLTEPLVWHAPKSEADLSDQQSMSALRGDAHDIDRLLERVAALTAAEQALLPPPSLRGLLSNRLERDDVEAVTVLLDEHPELRDAHCIQGLSPIIEAVDKRANRCLGLLLERGADPDARSVDTSALEICAIGPDYNLRGLQLLLACGADPNLSNPEGFTALATAVDYEWEAGVKFLLAHGARMDVRSGGLSCLEAAALNGKAEPVHWLLAAGAGQAEGLNAALIEKVADKGHHPIAAVLRAALLGEQLLDDR